MGKHILSVVKGSSPSLFGCDWLMDIRLDWQNMGVTNIESKPTALNDVLDNYSVAFRKELGTLKDFKARLTVKPNTKPQFCRAKQVPYALKDAVDK